MRAPCRQVRDRHRPVRFPGRTFRRLRLDCGPVNTTSLTPQNWSRLPGGTATGTAGTQGRPDPGPARDTGRGFPRSAIVPALPFLGATLFVITALVPGLATAIGRDGNLTVGSVAVASAVAIVSAGSTASTDTVVGSTTVDPGSLFLSIAVEPESGAALAVGDHGQIRRRPGPGGDWEAVLEVAAEHDGPPTSLNSPGSVLLTRVTFADPAHAWIAGHDATLLHSSDAGATWDVQFTDPEAEAPLLDLWFEGPTHGIAVGAFGLALETFDGGTTWEDRELDPEGPHFYGIAASTSGVLFVVGEFGTVLRSTDVGDTWERLSLPYDGTFFGIAPLADGAVLVFGLRGHVYRSEDDGTSWTTVESGTSASLLAALQRRDGSVLLVGLAGTILESRDGGRSFVRSDLRERVALTDAAELDGVVWLSSDQGVFPWIPANTTRADAGARP